MRAKNRLSPYPILSSFSDDYKAGSHFSAEIATNCDYGKLNIKVDFNLQSQYLQLLIDEKKAVFMTHIECPRTSYREYISNDNKVQVKSIPLDELTDAVEINTFIIAADEFEYSSIEFNQEYDGYSFRIEKGEILAIGDSTRISITNDEKDLESFPSIIRIVKVDEAEKAMSVDTDGDTIKIKLAGDVFDNYKTIGSSIFSKAAFSLIIYPSIIAVIARMVDADAGELDDRRWYQVLDRKLRDKNMPVEDLSLSDNSVLEACQRLFDDPVSKAFSELVSRSGGVYED